MTQKTNPDRKSKSPIKHFLTDGLNLSSLIGLLLALGSIFAGYHIFFLDKEDKEQISSQSTQNLETPVLESSTQKPATVKPEAILKTSDSQEITATSPEISRQLNADSEFGVFVSMNGKFSSQLYSPLVHWLSRAGGVMSKQIDLSSRMVYGILNGQTDLIKQSEANRLVKNVCIVNVTVVFEDSKINESLSVAKGKFETIILDASTGNIKETFVENIKAADISTENAEERVIEEFITRLSERNPQAYL